MNDRLVFVPAEVWIASPPRSAMLFRHGSVPWRRLKRDAIVGALLGAMILLFSIQPALAATLTGQVVDDRTGSLIPSRLYIQNKSGQWFFAESASLQGSAVRYEKRNWHNTNAVECHTTLSAHPFRVELEPGVYTLIVERGKEYRSLARRIEVGARPVRMTLPLHRWVNLAARGWFSGDTHVHRTVAELPNVMLAEDLNVAFPLTYWVTKAYLIPARGDKNADMISHDKLVAVDATHVICTRNTEFEIFTVNTNRHTLGAFFVLNHQKPLTNAVPPVRALAKEAHANGGLLELDKHNWPWSMMLVPVMGVDLYELANNHMWRTEFGFTNWATGGLAFMDLPHGGRQGCELDWIHYTLQNYYTLLNCGFRLRPTAGTASGVHPVPLGFGRVYVQLPGGFNYDAWIHAFDKGRSFVTTGPMLLAQINGQPPGSHFCVRQGQARRVHVEGRVLGEHAVGVVEVIVNGRVVHRLTPDAKENGDGAFEAKFRQSVTLTGSAWVAVRCWEPRERGRVRFAHTGPTFFEVPGEPPHPSKEEIAFLIRSVRQQIERGAQVLPLEAMMEYREALRIYESVAATVQ